MALHRFGIPALLPPAINLLSGPGCPVCVTGRGFIGHAIGLSMQDRTVVCTYGDLIRVPGSEITLEKTQADGANVRIVYSPLQCVEMAVQDPETNHVFLGIGFETTAPASAVALQKANELGLNNFFLYSAHKMMPPAMAAIIHAGVKVDAYLCPGHVSTIAGTKMYEPLVGLFGVGCVISGFAWLPVSGCSLSLQCFASRDGYYGLLVDNAPCLQWYMQTLPEKCGHRSFHRFDDTPA